MQRKSLLPHLRLLVVAASLCFPPATARISNGLSDNASKDVYTLNNEAKAGAPLKNIEPVNLLRGVSHVSAVQDSKELYEFKNRRAQEKQNEPESEPAWAVLFPWFAEMLGVVVFFLLSRYLQALPFTAVMFLLGTFMGIGAVRLNLYDQLSVSIKDWAVINSEVLLLIFLPGTVFRDAFGLNFHLFVKSLWQCLNLAFPMVLAGTALTALVGYYVFPYGWGFNLSMTFGSILSATDPVAVAALLSEVGAPPRLQMHIAGESMLNDGSAMVFYTIFSSMFLFELGIDGVGEKVGVGEGFALFFRMALAGSLLGIAFGLALILILYLLNRRLNTEENVLQVAATITVAYLSFYTADRVTDMSGVLCVVMCGVTTKAFGSNMINDPQLMESFWSLVEHLLDTLLFTLAGVVWGLIIANDGSREGMFLARDWGYLVLLYVLVMAIRFFLVICFYPLISRIGLKTNVKESIVLSYSGLRGAVGIALALSLDNKVWAVTEEAGKSEEYQIQSSKMFAMVGGVAFMTLVINGTCSGPLINKLGLADSTEVRKQVVESCRGKFLRHMLDSLVQLLSDPRYAGVDFAVVKRHVPYYGDLTVEQLDDAVHRNKENIPEKKYKEPNLSRVVPYLDKSAVKTTDKNEETEDPPETALVDEANDVTLLDDFLNAAREETDALEVGKGDLKDDDVGRASELRRMFLEMLRYAYEEQISEGELNGRQGFIAYELLQSLEFAADDVSQGKQLSDWEGSQIVTREWADKTENLYQGIKNLNCFCLKRGEQNRALTVEYQELRRNVSRAMAFVKAHKVAQERFSVEFYGKKEFAHVVKVVLAESQSEVRVAVDALRSYDHKDVKVIVSHLLCSVLLNKAADYVESATGMGVLKEGEARDFLDGIDESLNALDQCSFLKHPEERDSEA